MGSQAPPPPELRLPLSFPGSRESRVENCGERRAVCIGSLGFFFFCLISVISNHHEMTIKGFLMKKEITFIGLVF